MSSNVKQFEIEDDLDLEANILDALREGKDDLGGKNNASCATFPESICQPDEEVPTNLNSESNGIDGDGGSDGFESSPNRPHPSLELP